jgi:hypothetical protein
MRLHEFHRIGNAKSMAGVSHPGELIGMKSCSTSAVGRSVSQRLLIKNHYLGASERILGFATRLPVGADFGCLTRTPGPKMIPLEFQHFRLYNRKSNLDDLRRICG